MSNRLRRILAVTTAALLFSTVLSTSTMATTRTQTDAANAPAAVDVLLLRPAGFISLVVGFALFVVMSPIVLITRPHEIGTPFKELVVRPAKYLWVDPLGGH
jgi:putative copper export protein